MATILYPTRGGRSSYPNQDRAIEIARERGAKLLFFHVTDISFLDHVAGPVLVDAEQELDELGEFMMAMAQERAEAAGVEASYVIGRGGFRSALSAIIQEQPEVTTVLLGTPTVQTGVTSAEYLKELAQELRDRTHIEVIVFRQGEIVAHYEPPD